jgi:peptidoglycan/LPS O-acetylase OafA/YrhL
MSAISDLRLFAPRTLARATSGGRAGLDAALAHSHLPILDGVRAIAVFLVILYHFGFENSGGAAGVMIFFVLSGFLITWLLLKESAKTGDVSIGGFYKRRALRIFPAFYAYFALGLAIELVRGRAVPWKHALSAFFYYSNYYGGLVHPPPSFVSHTWSLAVEEQFYLLWPCIFWLLRKDPRRLARVTAAIIGCVWIHRAVLHFIVGVNQGYIYRAFDTRFDHLLVGCLLAIVLHGHLLNGFWNAACSSRLLAPVTLALLALSIRSGIDSTMYRNVIGFAIEPPLVAVAIAQILSWRHSLAWRWLDLPAVSYLGRISYSLYLYQEMTLYTARRLTAQYPVLVQLGFGVAATVAMASCSYFFVEKPFLKLKDRIGKPRAMSLAA